MGEIQGQIVIADVNDDGFPDIIACDTRGNVGVFNWKGKEIWERHLRSLISQGATVGDVNGDGRTEVVVGTSSGYAHRPCRGLIFACRLDARTFCWLNKQLKCRPNCIGEPSIINSRR